MEDKLLLHKVDVARQTVEIDGREYDIKEETFPTVNFAAENLEDVYQLTEEEEQVVEGLEMAFVNSIRLRQHIDFLYKKGSMYRIFNNNLLYHGCVPLDESGNFEGRCIWKEALLRKRLSGLCRTHCKKGMVKRCEGKRQRLYVVSVVRKKITAVRQKYQDF